MNSYEEGYGAGYSDGLLAGSEPLPGPFALFGAILGEIGLIALVVKWLSTHYNSNTKDLEFDSPDGQEAWRRIKSTAKQVSRYILEAVIIVVVFPIALVYYILRLIIGDKDETAKTIEAADIQPENPSANFH